MTARRLLNLTRLGWGIAAPVILLVTLGLATIHATERDKLPAPAVEQPPGSEPTLADVAAWSRRLIARFGEDTVKQAFFFVTGVGLMLALLIPSYLTIGRAAYVFYAVVMAMLVLLALDRLLHPYVHIPFVPVIRNTRRWIDLGALSIQPSEYMKLALVLALARHLRYNEQIREWRGLIVPFALTLAPMALIHFQPDLGTLLMLLPVLFAMLFAAGARKRHLATIALAGVAAAVPFYLFVMHDYQKQRIDVVLRQDDADERWHMGPGYQLRQAKIALATGGVWGEGYAQGVFVEHELLPEDHNDFIFAMIGHQWGLVGCAILMLAYALLVLCGFEVGLVTNEPFGRLLIVGVITMIVGQAIVTIGMTVGYFPITGVTLPFVSAGGNSLWANCLALGLLVNVAQRRPMVIGRRALAYEE